jgi:hypothetical protein
MAQVTLLVPGALVGTLRETGVLLYEATAEALHLSLRARSEGGSFGEVRAHRARLGELEAVLHALGWTAEGRLRDVELHAPSELLHDIVYGALLDAGERLSVACESGWRGEVGTDVVRAIARQVISLDRLLHGIDTGPASG